MVNKTIQFNHNGGALEISFIFIGPMVVSYGFTLFDSDQRTRLLDTPGDNVDRKLDRYPLPLPASVNEGRVIQLSSSLTGVDNISQNYTIKAELFQNGKKIDEVSDTGKLDGKLQNSLILITLK